MPSKQPQVVIRMTEEQVNYLTSLAEKRNTTLANIIMTELRKTYPELKKMGRVRKYERKPKEEN